MSNRYHINPAAGRPIRRYEQPMTSALAPVSLSKAPVRNFNASEPYPLNSKETVLLRRRLRGRLLLKEIKKMAITSATEVDVTYNRNGIASFDYKGDGNQSLFSKGACGYLAYAIHERTGLPFTIITEKTSAEYWQGHVAIKIGADKYLDVTGVNTMEEIAKKYSSDDSSFAFEDSVSSIDFKVSMGIAAKSGVYDTLQELEKAILKKLSHDLVQDFID